LITDMQLPGIGGVELSRRIRANGDTSAYVAVLSDGARGEAEGLGDTVDAVLSKPLREDELRAALDVAAQRASGS
jgi:CheY-like chemotaxis protein